MRVVVIAVRGLGQLRLALINELAVVEVAPIGWHAEVVAHVLGTGHLLAAPQQRLVELLAVAGADDIHRVLGLAHQAGHRIVQRLDGRGRRLLHEDVTVVAMLEGVQHQIHRIAFASVIMKRVVMLGSVMVMDLPAKTCSTKSGMTEPREAITLPKRVPQITVAVPSRLRLAATITFSIIALEMPMALIGYTALSVLRQTARLTPAATAASSTFSVPSTLVRTACIG